MTQDEIIEMTEQAGFFIDDDLTITSPFIEDICMSPMLKNFAKLVAAKEREACAKVCEDMTLEWEDQPHIAKVELATMMDCALAIRARGEQA
jgi:hypothetical protein